MLRVFLNLIILLRSYSSLCTSFTHKESSSFHFSIDEITITVDDMSCLLHLPIHSRLMKHSSPLSKEDDVELLGELLGRDLEDFIMSGKG